MAGTVACPEARRDEGELSVAGRSRRCVLPRRRHCASCLVSLDFLVVVALGCLASAYTSSIRACDSGRVMPSMARRRRKGRSRRDMCPMRDDPHPALTGRPRHKAHRHKNRR